MYERVLVPTDGSEMMEGVIDHAVELAAVHGATIHALYVANTSSLGDLPADAGWENVTEALRREGERAIAVVRDRAYERDVPAERAVREGSPATEITGYASEENCDIVVMGTHGRSGVGRLLLGSVTEKVVRSAEIPVLTIRVTGE